MRPPLRPPPDPPDDILPSSDVAAPGDAATAPADPPPTDLLDILDPVPPVETIDNPFGLSPLRLLFVEAYCGAANFRAARAYELAGFKTHGAAARANASRLLLDERVAKAIAARVGERVKALRIMDGDEALQGLSNLARSDIGQVVHKDHPIAKLAPEVRDWIKSVRQTKHGLYIELYDKMHAREVMAKVAGKLKDTVKVEHTLEDIMAAANREPAA